MCIVDSSLFAEKEPDMLTPFTVLMPANIRFGRGQAQSAAPWLAQQGGPVLLVHGASPERAAFLRHQLEALQTGAPLQARQALLRALRPYVEARLAEGSALKHITRHILGLFHGQPGGRAFRQILSEGAHRPGADWSLVEQALSATERDGGREAA